MQALVIYFRQEVRLYQIILQCKNICLLLLGEGQTPLLLSPSDFKIDGANDRFPSPMLSGKKLLC